MLDVHGSPSPVLPMPARWWHLFVHGAEHDWCRLKWLADVVALAVRKPDLVSLAVLRGSEGAGVERCVGSGLLLGERVFGSFLTDDVRAWAAGIPGTRLLADRAITSLAAESAESPRLPLRMMLAYARGRMALRGDVAYRRAEARRLLLNAGRNQAVLDPGIGDYAIGPLRWLGRHLRG